MAYSRSVEIEPTAFGLSQDQRPSPLNSTSAIDHSLETHRPRNASLAACEPQQVKDTNGLTSFRSSPRAALSPYIEYFWSVKCDEVCLLTLELFASDISGILVQHHDGQSVLRRLGLPQRSNGSHIPNAFVYGKRTEPEQLVARGPFELSGAIFRPQALHALLNSNPSVFNNKCVSIDELFDSRLQGQLLDARSALARLVLLEDRLSTRVAGESSDDELVNEGVRLLREQLCTIRIPRLLTHLKLSERQFERRFKRAVGVSPHHYLRILRFRGAVHFLRERRHERMADLASELGYADQSHFIKEVKTFSGYTPTALSETIRASIDLPYGVMSAVSAPESSAIDERRSVAPADRWTPTADHANCAPSISCSALG
jgi:AraC-like DNA-binding protein